ncbi:hypothetical protein L1987_35035 [Smallanthus sonchifolius]|uniref:Uncharacterized protein n=1 Tax=Smallanthus sonchifolius TaxID=185202 RepID=A0ACB9HWX0_9ASTR|nr:hypothetical protein L1987_35035 [Smallanthus sonchifolius]
MPSTSNLKQQERNWLDLPSDVMTYILNKVGVVDVLENAQKVCTAWHKVCKNPAMWKVINMNNLSSSTAKISRADLCKHVVDRSQGLLVDVTLIYDVNAELFLYVADRSSQVSRLEMVTGFLCGSLTTDALMKFPLLEELNLYSQIISKEEIETVGRYWPMLKTLKVNDKVPILGEV